MFPLCTVHPLTSSAADITTLSPSAIKLIGATTDIEYLNSLADLFYKLRDYYKNAFYVRDLNCFTYQTGKYSEKSV